MIQIILLRHGKPQHNDMPWITPKDLESWIAHYNQAGIDFTHKANQAAKNAKENLSSIPVFVSSQLNRSLQSAQYLAEEKTLISDDIFNEAALPFTYHRFPKLPTTVWTSIFRTLWLGGFSKNAISFTQEDERAKQATKALIDLANEHRDVCLVGHGMLNTLIAIHLRNQGWKGPRRPNTDYWGFSIYQYKN